MNLLVFARTPVKHLLSSVFFTFKKAIMLKKNENDHELISLLKKRNINIDFFDEKKFLRFNFDKKSQGIVLFIKKFTYISLEEILKKQKEKKNLFLIMLDCIEDPQNFGTIIRIAAALNIDGIVIKDKGQVPVNNTVIKVSTGGIAYVPICQVVSLSATLDKLKNHDFIIASTTCLKQTLPYNELKLLRPICVIFGNEHRGVGNNLVKKSHQLLYIPMFNKMNSLNVAVSCGIICSQIMFSSGKKETIISKNTQLNS